MDGNGRLNVVTRQWEPPRRREHVEVATLVTRLKRRDPAAQEELFHRYHAYCFKLAFRIVRNEAEAADQAQTAILRALVHIDDFEDRSTFGSWLARIVINNCLMYLRGTRRLESPESEELFDRVPARERPSPEAQFRTKQTHDLVRREVRLLPRPFREVVTLRYYEERPIEEIAAAKGMTVTGVKTRLHRAKHELRARLERRGVL
jgi:RNA polymerase sigma-70 factor, ECF subfamily